MVSILKPVKGIDSGAMQNFISFCEQRYGQYEILFGVADPADPVVAVIEEIQKRYPQRSIELYLAEPLGTNPKAATLHKLAREARGQILVICDADIRVTPDFLSRVVAPLSDPRIGLVTCLYRGELPGNLSARLEALHMDAAFAPSVALAWRLGTKVGLGATVVMRREDLIRCGGYAGCADHLLDDYEIAARIAKLGLKIYLSDYAVASVLGPMQFGQQFAREVRWSRGIRVAHPIQYPGMMITFTLSLALLAAMFTPVWPWAWVAVPAAMSVRWLVGWQSARLLGQAERRYLLWLPARDLLSLAVWCIGLVGRRVTWRGEQFLLRRDGRLEPISQPAFPDALLARAIRRLDAFLRRREGIFEFTDHAACVFRANVAPAHGPIALARGDSIGKGETVAMLHYWNEHVPKFSSAGPDLRWARTMQRAMDQSMRQLAAAAQTDPRLADVKAFGGETAAGRPEDAKQLARILSRFGFEVEGVRRRRFSLGAIHTFFENILFFALEWAFNPSATRGKVFMRPRLSFWISRQALLERYDHHGVTTDRNHLGRSYRWDSLARHQPVPLLRGRSADRPEFAATDGNGNGHRAGAQRGSDDREVHPSVDQPESSTG
jgi:ceramide glucosyltransferase